MRNERDHGAEFREHGVKHGAQEQRHQEKHQQNRSIPHDGTIGDDSDADEGARGVLAIRVGERLDEHVRNDEEDGHEYGEEHLGENDRAPAGPRNIARQLFRWVAEFLLLVTRDHSTREAAVSNPRVGMRSRVTAGHPS